MANISDVAREAGVSKATVSRVINGNSVVSEEMRMRVTRAMKRLNFQPNAQARSLSLKKSNFIGVIVPEIRRPFYGEIIDGIEETLVNAGYYLALCSTHNRPGHELNLARLMRERRVDGLIIVTPRELDSKTMQDLADEKFPVTLIDGTAKALVSSVIIDNYEGARVAVRHLIKLGHKRIGLIAGLDTPECRERLRGYRETLEAANIAFDPALVVRGDYLEESGASAMEQLLKLHEPPSAVFATSDLMAIGALSAIRNHDLQVPDDIALVGFDDIEPARWVTPSLTTVRQPLRQMGEIGAKKMLKILNGEEPEITRIVLSCELIERESTAPPLRKYQRDMAAWL
jgi:DNA-binding LacI/PurR family transcriptional regulator